MEQARERLDQALADLEQLIDTKTRDAAAAADGKDSDVEALKTENARLKSVTDDVSTRLDATIDRLRTLLKG